MLGFAATACRAAGRTGLAAGWAAGRAARRAAGLASGCGGSSGVLLAFDVRLGGIGEFALLVMVLLALSRLLARTRARFIKLLLFKHAKCPRCLTYILQILRLHHDLLLVCFRADLHWLFI